MKAWLRADEIAQLAAEGKLPSLPATKRGVNALAAREGWERYGALCRLAQGREGGGGLEYHIDLLPLSARLAYAATFLTVAVEDLRPPQTEQDGLSARARASRDAKLVLLQLAERFRRDQALPVATADTLFCGLFNSRSIALPGWIVGAIDTASPRTLARWRATREVDGDNALGHDPAAARKGTGALDRALDGKVKTFALAAIAKMPKLSTKSALELIQDRFGAQIKLPPLRTFQRQLAIWKAEHKEELQYLTDPDGWRSKTEFALVNSAHAERLNQIWQIDASPADVMLIEGRHSIYLAIDVFSRRVKVLATKTPRAAGVGLLIRRAILAWGVPEAIKIDNGSDFKASATQRLFAALGIEVEYSRPYSPREKGMVERAIGTFQRDLAGLPGFIGHSVADRKVIEGRKSFSQRMGADERELFGVDMDLAEFQQWCDDWSDRIYASTPHGGLGGQTPFAAAATYAGPVREIGSAAGLDMLLAPVPGRNGLRTMSKTGIRLPGGRYFSDSVIAGTEVFCRMDPADMGRILLFEPDGETFLSEAVCPELAGLDPVETIARVKAAQKARLKEGVAEIRRQMRKIGPRDVANAMRAAADRRMGNLIAFPRPSTSHETAALAAAADATRDRSAAAPLSGKAAELHAELVAAMPASDRPAGTGIAPVARLPETREQRFRRALALEKRIATGSDVPAAEAMWLGGYREGSEYRAMQRMLEDFGPEAIGVAEAK